MNPVSIPSRPSSALGALSPELDALLKANARRIQLSAKERLFHRGSLPDALYCVASGGIRLCVTGPNGRESLLSLAPPGHWFGEASIFTAEPRIHDAFAIVDTDLLAVSAKTLHALIDHRPDYLLEFLQIIGLRYKATLERIDGNALQPLAARLASILLEFSAAQSSISPPAGKILLRISQEDLGQMLGVSRQSINKILKNWEEQGVIEIGYRSLAVLQRSSLELLLGS